MTADNRRPAAPCVECGTTGGYAPRRIPDAAPVRKRGLCCRCYERPRYIRRPAEPRPVAPCVRCGTTGGKADPRKSTRPVRTRGLCARCYGRKAPGFAGFAGCPPSEPEYDHGEIQARIAIERERKCTGTIAREIVSRRCPVTWAEFEAARAAG